MLSRTLTAAGLALAAAVSLTHAAPAEAARSTAQFTSITVFGDSLVDAGNIFALTGGTTPSSANGYFQGRFNNGYDYTDLLSIALYGRPTTASLRGGTNFAYGGARASNTSAVPDLGEQLVQYSAWLGVPGRSVDANGLYVLNFGGNDIFNAPADPAAADAALRQSARDYAAGIQALNDRGVRNFLITGYPVLTNPLSFTAESYLTQELGRLTLATDTTLNRFSYLNFFQTVSTNPGAVGLPAQDLSRTCQQAGAAAIASGCVGIFSFDGTHPTAPVQEALFRSINSQFALTAAIPEPGTWLMMIAGFGAIGASLRRRRRHHALAA